MPPNRVLNAGSLAATTLSPSTSASSKSGTTTPLSFSWSTVMSVSWSPLTATVWISPLAADSSRTKPSSATVPLELMSPEMVRIANASAPSCSSSSGYIDSRTRVPTRLPWGSASAITMRSPSRGASASA